MDNPFGKILDIIVAVMLLFILPLLYFSQRTDTLMQQVVSTKAADLVDTVRSQGYLTRKMYETFLGQLDATNNIYDIHLEYKELALEPEYRFKTPEEVLGDQNATWTGKNIYHYVPVSTELPVISEADNDGLTMNTETNESILAHAVNGPADPNHVHTNECYEGNGQVNGNNILRIDFNYTHGNAASDSCYDYDVYNSKDARLLARFRKRHDRSDGDNFYTAYNYDSAGNIINSYSRRVSASTDTNAGSEGYLWWRIIQSLFCAETSTAIESYPNRDMSFEINNDSFLTKLSKNINDAGNSNSLDILGDSTEDKLERDLLGFIEATLDYSKVIVPTYSVKDIQLGNRFYKNAIITRTKSEIFTNYLGEIEINIKTNFWSDYSFYYTFIENRKAVPGVLRFEMTKDEKLFSLGLLGTYYVYEGVETSRIKPTTLSDTNYNYIPEYGIANLTLEDGSISNCIIQYAGGYKNGVTYYVPKFLAFNGYINKLRHTVLESTPTPWGTHTEWYYDWWSSLSSSWRSGGVLIFDYPKDAYPNTMFSSGQWGDFYVFTGVDTSYYLGEDYYYKHGNILACSSIITGITPTNPIQKVYLGNPLITTATVTFLDGSTKVVLCSADFMPNTLVKDKVVTLSYYGVVNGKQTGPYTCTITITVIPKTKTCTYGHTYNLSDDGSDPGCPYCAGWLMNLEVIVPVGGEISIYRGTTLIDNGVVLLATYFNGRTEQIYTGYADNLDKYYVGIQDVTISYKGRNTYLRVVVKRNIKKCDVCGKYYELYPDDTDPGCPFCKALIPVFTGKVLKYYTKIYSNEIMKELYEGSGTYYFQKGDYLSIDIKSSNETIGSKLFGAVLKQRKVVGIHVQYGGSIRDETKVLDE